MLLKNLLKRLSLTTKRQSLGLAGLLGMVLAFGPACSSLKAKDLPSLRAADLLAVMQASEGPARDLYPLLQKLGFSDSTNDFQILSFEDHPLFACMVGRNTGEKQPGLSSHLRRLILLKPGTLLVEDNLQGQQGETTWPLLWSAQKPVLERDSLERDQARIPGNQKVFCSPFLPLKGKLSVRREGEGFLLSSSFASDKNQSYRLIQGLKVGGPGEKKIKIPYELHLVENDLEYLFVVVAGREYKLSLPPWDLKTGQTGLIQVFKVDRQTWLERRPLAAGILPHTPEGIRLIDRWDQAYRGGRKPGWDIGRPARDLVQAVEGGILKPCRVVELGCGSGTNAIYLAQKGFDVTALDIAPTAIAIAGEKAKKAGVRVRFLLADVLAPPPLDAFDLIFDRGCYHGIRGSQAARYVQAVDRLSHPGTLLLILAGNANEKPHYGPPRVKEEDLRGDFSKLFDFVELRETHFDAVDPNRKGALAWFALLKRKGKP